LPRTHYNHLLNDIRDDVLRLGELVEQALVHSIHSLQKRNTTTALTVIQQDSRIDEARRNLEERAVVMLATQQPIVARDLRLLAVTSAIATELERIGDYACSIARRVYRSPDHIAQVSLPDGISRMIELAQSMLHTSLEAFLHQDAEMARSLGQTDDEVDALEDKVRDELTALIHVDVRYTGAVLDLIEVAHALERAADRATNIGERVIYLATCEMEEINP
jgi:phosphate transport system protein